MSSTGATHQTKQGGGGGGKGGTSGGGGRGRQRGGGGRGRGGGGGRGSGRGAVEGGGGSNSGRTGVAEQGSHEKNKNIKNTPSSSGEKDNNSSCVESQQQQKRTRQRNNRGAKNNKGKQQPQESKLNSESAAQKKQQEKEVSALEQQMERERKLEEERAQAEKAAAAVAAKQQEALLLKIKDATEVLKTVVDVTTRHKESRKLLHADSLHSSRKEFEANKKKLKTDLKKCTAFVKKVKSGAAWTMKLEDVTNDITSLNLSRYVEEVVVAILESKPKVADIPALSALCSAMHLRYPEFLPNLLPPLWDAVHSSKAESEASKSKRVYLRILTEFLLCGLLTETKGIIKSVVDATGGKDGNFVVSDPSLVVAFSKAAGFEVFAITPKSVKEAINIIEEQDQHILFTDAEQNTNALLAASLKDGMQLVKHTKELLNERAVDLDTSEILTRRCMGAFHFMSSSLVQTHSKLLALEKRCEQDRLLTGSLTEAREKGLVDARTLKDNLQKSVEILADVLHMPMPFLEEVNDEGSQQHGLGVEVWTKGTDDGDDDLGPFDDEEARSFYCDIPDLLTTIPPALLGMTTEQIERRKEENFKKYGGGTDVEIEEGESPSEVTPSSEAELDAVEDIVKGFEEHEVKDSDEDNGKQTHCRRYQLRKASHICKLVRIQMQKKIRLTTSLNCF